MKMKHLSLKSVLASFLHGCKRLMCITAIVTFCYLFVWIFYLFILCTLVLATITLVKKRKCVWKRKKRNGEDVSNSKTSALLSEWSMEMTTPNHSALQWSEWLNYLIVNWFSVRVIIKVNLLNDFWFSNSRSWWRPQSDKSQVFHSWRVSENKYRKRRRPSLLLPPFHMCSGHRKHPAGVQRLQRHHPENAPAAVWTLVISLTHPPIRPKPQTNQYYWRLAHHPSLLTSLILTHSSVGGDGGWREPLFCVLLSMLLFGLPLFLPFHQAFGYLLTF